MRLIKLTCQHCGEEFQKKEGFLKQHPTTKFCNRACYAKSKKVLKKCLICDSNVNETRNKYCSKECASSAKRIPDEIKAKNTKAYHRRYQSENRERINELSRIRNKTEKGRAEKTANRISRRGSGKITKSEIEHIKRTSSMKCYWCGANCEDDYHLDHYIPVAKGGKTNVDNMVLSCSLCNQHKSAKDPISFANSIGKLL